jgi:hypothetical protein
LNLWKACFTLGVSKNVQPKSSIPIGAKVEISPKGLPDAKYPLTSSVQRWFHLSFCIPFSPLHSSAREGFTFCIYYIHKVKKGKKLKTLQQNNAVPCKAALSGAKPAPDRAHLGYLASRQGRHRKELFNFPKLLINAELYGLVLAPRLKKGYHPIWEANLQTLGPMFQHLLIS